MAQHRLMDVENLPTTRDSGLNAGPLNVVLLVSRVYAGVFFPCVLMGVSSVMAVCEMSELIGFH